MKLHIPKHFHTYSMWGKLVHAQNFTWLWINCHGQVENWKAKTTAMGVWVGIAQWLEYYTRLVIERSGAWVPAWVEGEFSSLGSTFCANPCFSIHSTPMLLQQHIKDPGRSAKVLVTAKHTSTLHTWFLSLIQVTCNMSAVSLPESRK